MGQDTEELTTTPADIESTRQNLSRDIDELTDKVSPARVVERRKQAARGRMSSVKDKIMGAGSTVGDRASDATSGTSSSISGTATGALGKVEATAEGNPLAAGLVAFGAGMLISGLIPSSDKESAVAKRAVRAAKEHGQPLMDEAKTVGQEVGQNLKESATEAADRVRSTAQESADNVKQESQSSAQTVKDDATPS